MNATHVNSCVLTPEQIRTYEEDGVAHLPGAVARADAERMADALWSELGRKHAILRGHPDTWPTGRVFRIQAIAKAGAFDAMASPLIRAAIDHVLGVDGWDEPSHWGGTLATFPSKDKSWSVPHQSWHLDTRAQARVRHVRLARVFVLLADLLRRGGGTLFVAGSHRLIGRLADASPSGGLRSADAREALKSVYPWFAALSSKPDEEDRIQRLMNEEAKMGGVQVRVGEMTGKAGDAFLMHPYMLHAASDNVRSAPRLMLTHWAFGRNWDW